MSPVARGDAFGGRVHDGVGRDGAGGGEAAGAAAGCGDAERAEYPEVRGIARISEPASNVQGKDSRVRHGAFLPELYFRSGSDRVFLQLGQVRVQE